MIEQSEIAVTVHQAETVTHGVNGGDQRSCPFLDAVVEQGICRKQFRLCLFNRVGHAFKRLSKGFDFCRSPWREGYGASVLVFMTLQESGFGTQSLNCQREFA